MGTNSKSLSVVILTDNKKGHMHQSRAVAQLLPNPSLAFLPIHYKSKTHQLILSLLTYLPLPKFLISFFLTQNLKKESLQKIIAAPCHMIISTGSSLNAPNLFLSKLMSAKSVVIMNPSWGWKRHYDLQIVPKHDLSSFFYFKRSNRLITFGAPTLICEHTLKESAQKLSTHLKLPLKKYISLFIGGNSSHHTLTVSAIHHLIQSVERILQEKEHYLLITTSRRTPQTISQVLKNAFSNPPRCPLLMIAEESLSQPENLVSGMMGLSELILVTEDSISMISEAASSGKKVIVVQTDPHQKKSKHQKFIQELSQEGYIDLAPLPLLDKIILQKLESPSPHKTLNNMLPIREALVRLL